MSFRIQRQQVSAVLLTAVMLCSVVATAGVVIATPTDENVDNMTAAVDASSPTVEIVNQTIDDDTETTLHIRYAPGETDISNVSLALRGPPTNKSSHGLYQTVNATESRSFNTTLNQSGGTLAVTLPAHTFGGGTIPLSATLRNSTSNRPLVSDTQRYGIETTVALEDTSISPTSVETGENVTISATLNNTGGTADDFVVYANDSSGVVAGQFVTVGGNTETTVTFNMSRGYERTSSLYVNGEGPTEVTWESPITVEDRGVSTTSLMTGENLTLSATVTNTGPSEATRDINFDFGTERYTESVTLGSGATETVTVNLTAESAGIFHPYIAGESATEVTVSTRYDVSNTTVEPSTINIGESATVTTTLRNPTEAQVNETVSVRAAGGSYTRSVSLAPGENTTLSGSITPDFVQKSTIGVAGMRTDTSLTVRGVLQVVDESVAINESSVQTGDAIAVGFTYRNPSDSGQTIDRTITLSAGGDYERVDVTLAPGETQQISRVLEPTTAGDSIDIDAGTTMIGSIEVTSPVVIENVTYDHVVAAGETANVVYTLNNTDDSAAHSRALSVYTSTNDGASVTADTTAELAPGERRNVTLNLQMQEPGSYWASFTGRADGGIAVLNDTEGTADVTVNIRPTESVSIRNEARFYVNVSNDGTADAGQPVTLRRTPGGEILDETAAYVKPGEYEFKSVSMEFDSPGEKTVYINGEPQNITVTEPYIQETNISVVNGTEPRTMPVAEGGYDRGYLNVEFRINEERASSYDLARIGADRTTRFKVEMTVRDFDPSTVIATGKDVEWNYTSLSNNRTRVTLYLTPAHQSYLQDAPSLHEWDDGQRVATSTIENTVQFRVYGDSPDSSRNFYWTEGLAVSTNAQSFSAPYFYNTSAGKRFEIMLAAPHFREDGSLNQGHYTAHLPGQMLDRWNVTSASELEAAYTGTNDTTIDITETADGMRVDISLHYSSGTARVGEIGAVDGTAEDTNDGTTGDDTSSDDGTTGDVTSSAAGTTGDDESDAVAGGGGGGGGQSSGAAQPSIRTIPTDEGATVNIRDVSPTTPFTANLTAVGGDAVGLESLTFDFTFEAEDFRVEATTPTTAPQGTAELPDATAVSYFDLDAVGLDDDKMDHARLTIDVGTDALPADATPGDVVIYHHVDGEWQALETEHLGQGRFAANTTGFSPFAVGVEATSMATTTPEPTESADGTAEPEETEASEQTETASDEASSETGTESPGFGVVGAILALLSVAMWTRREGL